MKWVDAREELPEVVVEPVLIVFKGVTQNLTYALDESEAHFSTYWFEDSEYDIPVGEVSHWTPIPKSPQELHGKDWR